MAAETATRSAPKECVSEPSVEPLAAGRAAQAETQANLVKANREPEATTTPTQNLQTDNAS